MFLRGGVGGIIDCKYKVGLENVLFLGVAFVSIIRFFSCETVVCRVLLLLSRWPSAIRVFFFFFPNLFVCVKKLLLPSVLRVRVLGYGGYAILRLRLAVGSREWRCRDKGDMR
jgi:hypothetical protein